MKFNDAKYNRLSEICSSIAQIAIASVVIPFLVDKSDPIKVIWGLVLALVFWIFSLMLAR